MSLVRSLIAAAIAPTRADLAAAAKNTHGALRAGFHNDTAQRRKMRALLDGAALAGAHVKLAFYKADWQLRYMLCTPCMDTDQTASYYTVVDVEASEAAERAVYRRVRLDTVVGASVEYRASYAS
jgi:hypothetical protein